MNVALLLEHAATRWPARDALIDADSGDRLTFAQLSEAVRRMAGQLLAAFPLRAGDRVALLGEGGTGFLCADYAVLAAGLVRVSLDPALAAGELLAQLQDSGARALLYGAPQADLAHALASSPALPGMALLPLDALARGTTADAPMLDSAVARAPDDIAALNYTGGTTGLPKAVIHSHGSYRAVLDNVVQARRDWAGTRMLNVRPLWPIAAVSVLAHLVDGGTLIQGAPFEPARFVALVERFRPSCTSLVPTHLVRILRHLDGRRAGLASLRCIEIGAAPMPPALLAEAVEVFGAVFSVIYGLTEAPWSCYRTPADLPAILADPTAGLGRVGRATAHSEIAIGTPAAPLPAGEAGEIWLRGPHLMRGYWHQPARSAETLRDGWLRTGDLGLLDADGRLHVQGRLTALIRSGGKSVQPAEVEEVLCAHPDILEAAVVGLPDPEWGERVAAAIVLRPGHAFDAAGLAAFCRARLSSHKRPRVLRPVPALPRSHYGKVLTGKVRDLLRTDRLPDDAAPAA